MVCKKVLVIIFLICVSLPLFCIEFQARYFKEQDIDGNINLYFNL